MSDILNLVAASDDTSIQSLVWMAEGADLVLPPVPERYLLGLAEVEPMTCFTTDPALVPSLGFYDLENQLSEGRWPKTGMALRYQIAGRWAYWQYLLVGRVHLIQVNLRLPVDIETGKADVADASIANLALTDYFQNEITLARYLSEGERGPEELARLVIYENRDGGKPKETHFTWSADRGLTLASGDAPVFTSAQPASNDGEGMIIYA